MRYSTGSKDMALYINLDHLLSKNNDQDKNRICRYRLISRCFASDADILRDTATLQHTG